MRMVFLVSVSYRSYWEKERKPVRLRLVLGRFHGEKPAAGARFRLFPIATSFPGRNPNNTDPFRALIHDSAAALSEAGVWRLSLYNTDK